MDKEKKTLLDSIGQKLEIYAHTNDQKFLDSAYSIYKESNEVQLNTEELSYLKKILSLAPRDFFLIHAQEFTQLLNEHIEENTLFFTLDYQIKFYLLNERELIGEDNFADYLRLLQNSLNNIGLKENQEIILLWISFLVPKVNYEIASLITISENYVSWLAHSLMAEYYLLHRNFENAIIQADISNKILGSQLDIYNDPCFNGQLFEQIRKNLEREIGNNFFIEIESYFYSGKIEQCICRCNEVLALPSETIVCYAQYHLNLYLSFSYSRSGNYRMALNSIEKASSEDSILSPAYLDLAIREKLWLLEKMKKFQEKIVYLGIIAKVHPSIYKNYRFKLKELDKKDMATQNYSEQDCSILKPKLDKPLSKRLVGEISHSGNEFTSEKLMEAFIVSYIDSGTRVFGRHFQIYKDKKLYGRQFSIRNGYIDLLLVDKETNDLYIIELKKDKGYNNPTAQINHYRDYVTKHVAKKNQKVFCIICLKDCDDDFKESVRQLDDTHLYSYDLLFKLES